MGTKRNSTTGINLLLNSVRESIIMYRKIIMIVISVFLSQYGVVTQALVVFLLLIVFLITNIKLRPFSTLALNDMETMSLIAGMITIYCGLFYISDIPAIYDSENDNGRKC